MLKSFGRRHHKPYGFRRNPIPSVVYVMFNYCHVTVYVQIEK